MKRIRVDLNLIVKDKHAPKLQEWLEKNLIEHIIMATGPIEDYADLVEVYEE